MRLMLFVTTRDILSAAYYSRLPVAADRRESVVCVK